jgi:aminobenzoyl-glutamate utilization protein B
MSMPSPPHIGDRSATGFGLQNYALIGAKFTFKGRTAHGGVNPWDGKDAVDAVVLMDIGFDKLREHLRPTYRGHRTITNGGVQPNIIPDSGQIWWFVRDASEPWAKENFDKPVNIGRGAAPMTETTTEMEPFGAAWPTLGNRAIAEAIQNNDSKQYRTDRYSQVDRRRTELRAGAAESFK